MFNILVILFKSYKVPNYLLPNIKGYFISVHSLALTRKKEVPLALNDNESHKPRRLQEFLGMGPPLEPELNEFKNLEELDLRKHVFRYDSNISREWSVPYNRYQIPIPRKNIFP